MPKPKTDIWALVLASSVLFVPFTCFCLGVAVAPSSSGEKLHRLHRSASERVLGRPRMDRQLL